MDLDKIDKWYFCPEKICYFCKRKIGEKQTKDQKIVTGCPFCNHSFVD